MGGRGHGGGRRIRRSGARGAEHPFHLSVPQDWKLIEASLLLPVMSDSGGAAVELPARADL